MSRSRHPAATPEQASALDDAALDRLITAAHWRIGNATNAALRNGHRRRLAMLLAVRAGRKAAPDA